MPDASGEASNENDSGNVIGTESDKDDATLYKSKALIRFELKQYSAGPHFAVSVYTVLLCSVFGPTNRVMLLMRSLC